MKFILLTHERELQKATNTGRLAKQVLGDDLEIIVWKRKEPDQRLLELLASKQAAILFPDVFPTISRASRMETPLEIMVLEVRVNFATATFRIKIPMTGSRRNMSSIKIRPLRVA